MMERTPQKWFAAAWLFWYGCVWWALMTPGSPTLGLIVLLAFLPIEGLAVALDTGSRDTLSEVATWVWQKASKHRQFGRGWNAAMLGVVLTVAYLLGRTLWHYADPVIALPLAGLVTVWLYDHWSDPVTHG